MRVYEQNMTFSEKWGVAKQYDACSSSKLLDYFSYLIQSLRPYPALIDYAVRINEAEVTLNKLSTKFPKSSKFGLETLLLNLAPDPEQVSLAISGSNKKINSTLEQMIPLNDDIAIQTELVKKRYYLFAQALEQYVEIGLTDIEQEFKEISVTDFNAWFESEISSVPINQDVLSESRKELFLDFPEEELRSVEEAVIYRENNNYTKNETLLGKPKGRELEKTIRQKEDILKVRLREILSRARREKERLELAKSKYNDIAINLEVLKNFMTPYLAEYAKQHIDNRIEKFRNSLNDHFNLGHFFSKKILHNIVHMHTMYGNGMP
jgi:hypothetical protein